MFVDASAIVAILGREPGYEEIEKRLASTDTVVISPLVRFESVMALARLKSPGARPAPALVKQAELAVAALLEDTGAREEEITPAIGLAAIEASARYGKTVGHPADLNFGDCFAYACAKAQGLALLYKGNDFALTDLA